MGLRDFRWRDSTVLKDLETREKDLRSGGESERKSRIKKRISSDRTSKMEEEEETAMDGRRKVLWGLGGMAGGGIRGYFGNLRVLEEFRE